MCAVWARHQAIWRVPKSGREAGKEGKRIREAISRAVSTDSTQQRGKDNEIGERARMKEGKGSNALSFCTRTVSSRDSDAESERPFRTGIQIAQLAR